MNALYQAAAEVGLFMAERQWPFCIIGGLAVLHWGEPRTTLDVDMTLLTGWGEEEPYVRTLLERFESRIPDGYDFALNRRVLLLRASNGKEVDIALGALPFEEEMVSRAVWLPFAPEVTLPCCTAEDLFIMKAFANRARDWIDAESILIRQTSFDSQYALGHLVTLCELKEMPEILERARQLLETIS